jgi:hypothetical protein
LENDMKNKNLVENKYGHGGIRHSKFRHWLKRNSRPKLGKSEVPFDWSKPIPMPNDPIKNQGTNFSCGRQAGSYLQRILLRNIGKEQGEISAKSGYGRYCAPGGGMTIDAVETCVGAFGANLEATVPSYALNSTPEIPLTELEIEDVSWETAQTDADALTRAGLTPVTVNVDKDSMAEAIRDYGGIIMLIQGQNGNQPYNWTTATPAPPQKGNPDPLWEHYMCLAGTNTTQLIAFQSWGTEVGSRGLQAFDETYINSGHILDCFAFVPDGKIEALPVTMAPWTSLLAWFHKLLQ